MLWTTIYLCYTYTTTTKWENHAMGMLPGVYPLAIYILDGGKLTRFRWYQIRIEEAGHATGLRWVIILGFCAAVMAYWRECHPPEHWIMSVFSSLLATPSYTPGTR
jgi:tryptophan-rich sensory protein